jgi:SAM-dependent methyltransferase
VCLAGARNRPRILNDAVRHEFITLFDANYLPRGVALHRSLVATGAGFRLRVVCMDAETESTLRQLALPDLTIIPLAALEEYDPELLAVKDDRTSVEYCWTATPAVCLYALATEPELDAITYLDADLMFFSDPQPLFDELGDDAVLIVPHRYAPEHRLKESTSGTYNVEWLTFRRDPDGLAALSWWHDRCIEWCYARYEDGKMGDQKYLDDWPERFKRVHVLQHPGGGLAPWNVTNHRLGERNGRPTVDSLPLVFYHHHSLRLFRRGLAARASLAAGQLRSGLPATRLAWATNYEVSADEARLVWIPYLAELTAAHRLIGKEPDVEDYPASVLIRKAARFARRSVGRAVRAVDPVARLPGARSRYTGSWQSGDVARQMLELTEAQLKEPETVAPYVAFRKLVGALLVDPALPSPARILDIGAGAGAYGELLSRWWPGRFDYVGADYSEEILAVARERWQGRTFVQKDIHAPGALGGNDVVMASALLDVLAEIEPGLRALLASDARFVLLHRQRIDPHRSRVELARGYRGQRTYRTYITRAELEAAASQHGREISAEVVVEADVHSFLLVRP